MRRKTVANARRPSQSKPSWDKRRWWIALIIVFCMVEIAILTIGIFWNLDPAMTGLATTLVLGAFGLLGSTIGSYIFGATWDDKNVLNSLGSDPYQDCEPEPRWRRRVDYNEHPNNTEEPG